MLSSSDDAGAGGGGKQDNREHAHTHPSLSKFAISELFDNEEDNALRRQFLLQGVLPPPPRPVITNTTTDTNPNRHHQHGQDNLIPENELADPSGVSSANPEDILDMASMYDPSLHLPDKPNFNSPSNRRKYESGTPLTDELIAYIGVRGPITVAEYMRRVLRDGKYGYYTSKGSRMGRGGGGKTKHGDNIEGDDGEGVDEKDENDWDIDEDNDRGDESTKDNPGGEHVIGSGGDFITAPEVSQLFGESLLVWLMTQYRTLNAPSQIQIIEIGPGKGTLICDIVRSAISTFPDFALALTNQPDDNENVAASDDVQSEEKSRGRKNTVAVGVHLVEVTNGMRARQKESIRCLSQEKIILEKGYTFQFADDDSIDDSSSPSTSNSTVTNERRSTITFSWHDVLSSVPTHDAVTGKPIPTFVVCQELVDALPIHSFQKIEGDVWRERLVDVAVRDEGEASEAANSVRLAVARRYASAESNDTTSSATSESSTSTSSGMPDSTHKKIPRLRFVLPPDTTPALRSLLQVNGRGSPTPDNPSSSSLNSLPVGSIIEACPEGLVLVQDIADRIERCHGGAALIIDYGGDGSSGGDTLRGFWKHTQVHPLSKPGEVDVTADVDFGALREAVNRRVSLSESLERKRRQDQRSRIGNVKSVNGNEETTASVDDFHGSNEGKLRPEAFGPISQGKFLAQMGIVQRVEKKIEDPETTDDEAYELYSAMERLLLAEQMGERYKVLAIAPKKDDLFPPPGF